MFMESFKAITSLSMKVVFLFHSFQNLNVISDQDLDNTAHADAGHFFLLFGKISRENVGKVCTCCTDMYSTGQL